MSGFYTSVKLPVAYLETRIGDTADFKVLVELRDVDGMTQKELVDSIDRSKSTISESLNRLEEHGIVCREEPADDRMQPKHFSLVTQEMFQ
jgi:predicted transcriptional regulator